MSTTMYRISNSLLRFMLLFALFPAVTLAAASSTAPMDGDMAVSFNAGVINAFDDDFEDLEPVFTGTFEYYTNPRFSWRGLLGVTSFDSDLPGNPSLDVNFFTANALYNWEHGKFHPYVTGGVGVYQKDGSSNLLSRFDENVFGVNGGGGIDWYLGSRWALEFEGTFHATTGESPDTLFIGTVGAKFWF